MYHVMYAYVCTRTHRVCIYRYAVSNYRGRATQMTSLPQFNDVTWYVHVDCPPLRSAVVCARSPVVSGMGFRIPDSKWFLARNPLMVWAVGLRYSG